MGTSSIFDMNQINEIFSKKTLFWRLRVSLLYQPQRILLFGASLLLIGVIGQFFDAAFTSSAQSPLSFAFSVVSVVGVALNFWSDIFIANIWQMAASPFFVIGMALVSAASGLTHLSSGALSQTIGSIGIAGTGCIFFAMALFFVSVKDTFRMPLLGPHNYFLWGGVCFCAGTLLIFLNFLSLFPVFSSTYPGRVIALVGYFLLSLGALCFWCSSTLMFESTFIMVLHRYPSTSVLRKFPRCASWNLFACLASDVGGFVAFLSLASSSSVIGTGFLWGFIGGVGIVAVGRLTVSILYMFPKDILMTVGTFLDFCGLAVLCAGIATTTLANPVSLSLIIASGSVSLAGSLLLIFRSFLLGRKNTFFACGNFPAFAQVFQIAAACCLIVYGAHAPVSLNWLLSWAFLISLGESFSLFFSSNVIDVATAFNYASGDALSWDPDATFPVELKGQFVAQDDPLGWASAVNSQEYDVIIAGAGPAGLTAINELCIRGLNVAIFDIKETVVPDSRFFLMNPATIEGLWRLGVCENLFSRGQQNSAGWGSCFSSGMQHPDCIVFGNAPAYSRDVHSSLGNETSRLSSSRSTSCSWASQPGYRCVQSAQEAVLLEGARRFQKANVMFQHRVLDFRVINEGESDEYVLVLVKNEITQQVFKTKARFLVGCDGALSTVARLLKTKFDGFTNLAASRSVYFRSPNLFDSVKGKLCESHQYHVVRKNVGVAYFALRDIARGLWTFHLHALFDGRSPSVLDPDELYEMVQEFSGPEVEFEVITDGRWKWNFAIARTFRKGPVFLAGDACHSWPPFLGNGGNTAYQDVTNLCWKLEAAVRGWGGESLLQSYDLERRDQVLRNAMGVIANTPSPTRLKIAGRLLFNFFTKFIVLARWFHTTSGEHLGNNFCQSGLSYGCRYDFSPAVLGGDERNSPPEDPFPVYIPKLVPGGRVLHVEFTDTHSVHDLIKLSGYTIFKTSSLISKKEVEDIVDAFETLGAEITSVDISEKLISGLRAGKRNSYVATLWTEQQVVICRPDLYVSWTKAISLEDKNPADIASRLCGKSVPADALQKALSMNRWLTWRMYEGMKPMRQVFTKGTLVKNKEKEYLKENASKADVIEEPSAGDSNIPLQLLGKKKDENTCPHCEAPFDGDDFCMFNENKVHPRCLAGFRKNVGISDKVCAFCNKMVIRQSSVTKNRVKVHEACLKDFKAFRNQFEHQMIDFG